MTRDTYGNYINGAQQKSIEEGEFKRFPKTLDPEPGAARGITSDQRFTKPLLEILYHLSSIGQISQQLLSRFDVLDGETEHSQHRYF
jgi:hypothetical protein